MSANEGEVEATGGPIRDLERRVERLEAGRETEARALDRAADLERALGGARYELRRLLRDNEALRARAEEVEAELAASREVRDRAAAESRRRGERVAELEAEVERLREAPRAFAVLRWTGERPTSERPDFRRFEADVAAFAAFERALGERGAAKLVAVLRESAQDTPAD